MVEEDIKKGYVEELIECPFCSGFVPDEFECILCGEEILETEVPGKTKLVCSRCGSKVKKDSESCPECGAVF
ncbi:MAG: hypothetical protein KGY66_07460 [Candidatus Thermoplasmatota archaeon]|nr:hypothetical protein [Candidatus Thermoplasmatota archaeon]MBS3790736.1 hypothetical protein [Candidatus Thermoplasmatota archaeon]